MGHFEEEQAEENRLRSLSVVQLRKEYDKKLRSELTKAIQSIPGTVRGYTEQVAQKVLTASLGIKKDTWHNSQWEVDHNNPKSAVGNAIGQIILEQLNLAIPDFIASVLSERKDLPDIKKLMRKNYDDRLANLAREGIYKAAVEAAQQRWGEIQAQVTAEILTEDREGDK